jgi:hypothetical protein
MYDGKEVQNIQVRQRTAMLPLAMLNFFHRQPLPRTTLLERSCEEILFG